MKANFFYLLVRILVKVSAKDMDKKILNQSKKCATAAVKTTSKKTTQITAEVPGDL